MANMLSMPPSKAVAALTPKEGSVMPAPPPVKPNALATNAMGNTAMTPQQSPYAAAMAPKPKQNALLGSALDGFMRGFRPQQWQADQDKQKMDGAERAKNTLALMQQQRALPVEQRAQWWQQNADQIGQIVGGDVKSLPMDANSFSDQALDGQIAMISAKLGIAPATPEAARYQGMGLGDGGVGVLNQSTGKMEVVREPTIAPPKPADPVKMETIQGKDGRYYSFNPYTNETKPLDVYGRVPGEGGDGSAAPPSGYRWNPDGSLAKIPGGPADKPEPGLYTPTEEKNYRAKSSGLSTLKNLTDQYRAVVNQYGPGLFDGKMDGLEWKKTPEGQKLLAAHNNLMMFVKGDDMFKLGVLAGPDVERLQRTLPEPVGPSAFGQSKETIGIGLDSIDQLIGYQLNQIPDEYRAVKPQAPKPTMAQQGINALGDAVKGIGGMFMQPGRAQPQMQPQAKPPAGVDPLEWQHMTPEEKALFQ